MAEPRVPTRTSALLPLVTGLVLAASFTVAWVSAREGERTRLAEQTEVVAEQAALRLEGYAAHRIGLLRQIAGPWRADLITDRRAFVDEALAIHAQYGGYQALNWISPDHRIEWITPELPNLLALGRSLLEHPYAKETYERALGKPGLIAVTPPILLWQGGEGFTAYLWLGEGKGTLNAVFRYEPLAEASLTGGVLGRYGVRLADGPHVVYQRGWHEADGPRAQRLIDVGGRTWTLDIVPLPHLLARGHQPAWTVYLALGLVLAAGLAATLRHALVSGARLGEARARHAALVAQVPDLVLLVDLERHLVEEVQGTAQRLPGSPAAPAAGVGLRELFPPSAWPAVEGALGAMRAGARAEVDLELDLGQGGELGTQIAFELRAVRCGEGRALLVLRDVSERRRTEHQRRLLAEMIERTSDLVAMVDAAGDIQYMNPAGLQMLGVAGLEELQGRPIGSIRANPEKLPEVERGLATGDRWRGEVVLSHQRTGAQFPVELRLFVIRDLATGAPLGRVGVARDLSELRRLEAALLRDQTLKAVGQLAGGVAHDFNNVLTTIFASAELAERALPADHPAREDLAELLRAGRLARDLVAQLLAAASRRPGRPRAVELVGQLREQERMLRRLIREDVRLEVSTEGEPLTVRADPTQLEQVLLNLVVNACDAMPDGGALRIALSRVESEPDDAPTSELVAGDAPLGWARLEVCDTGVGMSEAVRQRAFEPFYTTKARGRGTGLGLATVYGVVRQHGGRIRIESEVGVGTTFEVELPLIAPEAESASEPPPLSAPIRCADGVLLLAEDDPAVRRLAARVLRETGLEVVEAADGAEALERAAALGERLRLVVTDAVMPQLGGAELARRLREQRPSLAILVTSGYADPEDEADPSLARLAKPYSADQLLAATHELLGGRSEA